MNGDDAFSVEADFAFSCAVLLDTALGANSVEAPGVLGTATPLDTEGELGLARLFKISSCS